MKPTEALLVITALNRAGLAHAVEGQAEVWARALSQVSPDDALAAVDRITATRTSENRWVVPGDVLEAVRSARNDRVRAALDGAAPLPPREIDPDDVGAYQAWRKAFLKALGDGRSLRDAESVACQVVGIPVVHRGVEAHQVRRLESS